MSEEEKKDIEYLKKYIKWETYGERSLETAIATILNLFENQQKEIEDLKDLYSDEKIRNTIIKRYREVIEKDYISKDKIKKIISEEFIMFDAFCKIKKLVEE